MGPEKGLLGLEYNAENIEGFTLRDKIQSDIDDVTARLGDAEILNNERKKLTKRLNMLTNMQESLLKEGKNGNGGKSKTEATVKKNNGNGNGNSDEATPESWYRDRRDIIKLKPDEKIAEPVVSAEDEKPGEKKEEAVLNEEPVIENSDTAVVSPKKKLVLWRDKNSSKLEDNEIDTTDEMIKEVRSRIKSIDKKDEIAGPENLPETSAKLVEKPEKSKNDSNEFLKWWSGIHEITNDLKIDYEKAKKKILGEEDHSSRANSLTSQNMTGKETGQGWAEEAQKAYEGEFKKTQKEEDNADLYSELNRKNEEQEKTTEAYKKEYGKREDASQDEKEDIKKLRKKEDIKKEKRASELKEKEEFADAYKAQFGENEKKTDSPDINKAKSGTGEEKNDRPLQEKVDRLSKSIPDEAKEMLREKAMDDEVDRIVSESQAEKQDVKIESLTKESVELKENLEKAEERLKNAEIAINEKIQEMTEKDATITQKFVKFLRNPKVKTAIGFGLIGASAFATGGGTLIGAWLGLPYGLGIPALGGTSNLIAGALGSALAARAFKQKMEGDFRQNLKEVLGVMKNETDAKNENEKPGMKTEQSEISAAASEEKPKGFWDKFFRRDEKSDEKAKVSLTGESEETPDVEKVISKFQKELREFNENFKIKFEKKQLGGEEVLEFAEMMAKRGEMGGSRKEDAADAFSEVYGKDAKIKGAMVDAMAVYADKKGIKGSDVLEKYLPYFEVNEHIGRRDVYEWLIGEKAHLPENEPEIETEPAESKETLSMKKAAKEQYFELSRAIADNKEEINTAILEKISDLLDENIKAGDYEAAASLGDITEELLKDRKSLDLFISAKTKRFASDSNKKIAELIKEKVSLLADNKFKDKPEAKEKLVKNVKEIYKYLNLI